MLVVPITIFRSFIGEAALAEEKICYKCQVGEKNEQVDTGSKNIGKKEGRKEGKRRAKVCPSGFE